ncbi:MAG: hypothetical protein FJ110_14965 [Deltaproteobacteria bacterium]|nr:hypothetical protein [Deltaproteobacteria bacterium]
MTETPFFFPNGNYRLFGVLHQPTGPVRKEGFVFCAPFAEEKLWAHRVFVNFARDLTAKGYPVLRFDYMGNGDSEGNFEESTLDTMLSDTRCAINTLREKVSGVESINLLGLRLGATVASLVGENGSGIRRLILWEPVIDGSAYIKEILRINLATQTAVYKKILHNTDALIQMMKEGKTVNIEGYEMAWPLYEQIAGIDLNKNGNSCESRVLFVQISRKEGNVSESLKRLKEKYAKSELAVAVEEPFWKEIKLYYARAENLFRLTHDWLSR